MCQSSSHNTQHYILYSTKMMWSFCPRVCVGVTKMYLEINGLLRLFVTKKIWYAVIKYAHTRGIINCENICRLLRYFRTYMIRKYDVVCFGERLFIFTWNKKASHENDDSSLVQQWWTECKHCIPFIPSIN